MLEDGTEVQYYDRLGNANLPACIYATKEEFTQGRRRICKGYQLYHRNEEKFGEPFQQAMMNFMRNAPPEPVEEGDHDDDED